MSSLPRAFALSFLLGATALAQDPLSDRIRQGDAFDQQLQAQKALECYLPAEKAEPQNLHVLLGIARQYRHLSADAAGEEEKMRLAKMGQVYAMRAVAINPDDAEAHLSVAISYAKMVPLLGNKEKMEASRRLKVRPLPSPPPHDPRPFPQRRPR